ncbi:Competence protein [Aquiflexum balticum DSM 16537]|uniref:Competence protein n=1 Tax=Aquiflexum balticum DSM 16537 TaxID=758820 RepID=A0A1W2H7C9_9BACT|nr:competence protein CoiA family protein [Aquiflexum balticum]SMD44825.1 Competence protein [Aquiflexum balticum DSM 16537]
MRYAIVNGTKTEATKGLKGICPSCRSELIAKCGERKINHWAHIGVRSCDPWWEPETEWHRTWKSNYPVEWQEVFLTDEETDEKHIADIRTSHNLVVEFQHSYLDKAERTSRERFYKNMVWIVDGTRLKRDYPRFLKGRENFRNTNMRGIFKVDLIEEVFPENWLTSSVPVIFDFKVLGTIDNINDFRNLLYCLIPVRIGRYAILAEIPRKAFINASIDGSWSLRVQEFIENLTQPKPERQNQIPEPQVQVRKNEPSHYFDPRKNKFIKKRRL